MKRNQTLTKLSRNRRGVAAVEFALVLPLLFLPLLTIVDFARVYRCTQVVADGARIGAMYLSNPDVADKSPYATFEAAVLAGTSDLSPPPTMTSRNGFDGRGNRYYEVSVSYTFRPVMLPSSTKVITRTVRARMYPAAVLEIEG